MERAEETSLDPFDEIMDSFGSGVVAEVGRLYEQLSKIDPLKTIRDLTESARPLVESVKQGIEDISQQLKLPSQQ